MIYWADRWSVLQDVEKDKGTSGICGPDMPGCVDRSMAPSDNKTNRTPAMQQYRGFKEQYPEAILFFRVGDFYETFYEDAEICSRVLGIALTCRNKGSDSPIPLAGVPYHAVEGYLNKMIRAGHKVAVCEQVEDPAQAKGVVKRDVVRVVTPGTLTEEALLDERRENYLASVCFDRAGGGAGANGAAGLAWVDLSTGRFCCQAVEDCHLLDELVRLRPAECLVCEDGDALPKNFSGQLAELIPVTVTPRVGWAFDAHHAYTTLTKHFGTASLEGFGFTESDCSVRAAGVVIEYLNETQKTSLGHIARLQKVRRDRFLKLDQTTLRSLEVERTIRDRASAGSLLHSLDKTLTSMGARKFQKWLCYPLADLAGIEQRQESVAELLREDTLRDRLRKCLGRMGDIERITTRVSTGRATPRDLLGLAQALRQLPEIVLLLEPCETELLMQLSPQCNTQSRTADLITAAIDADAGITVRDGGVIRSGYDEEIDRLRSLSKDGQMWLAGYQKKLIEQTGFAHLKVGYNRVFGYYVEVSHAFRGELPGDFVRKQTLKNAERYITDELKRYEAEALTAQQRCRELEQEVFQDIRIQVAGQTLHLQQVADAAASIDVLAALAHLARSKNYCKPQMHSDKDLKIIEGRHPVLDATLGQQFIPNDVTLGQAGGADIAIITGPNMSGKSTYIRQTALLVLMAHTGSFIPARSAEIGLVDRIFTRVGASDEIARGQSTFMVEMTETANIINNATERSLVILDEIGRGTSTYDGLSLAWAITEYIATTIKCRTLFATHYHEITELGQLLGNVKNENVAVREWKDQVVFLHKIVPGRTDKSYGIHVARLAGIPAGVLHRSQEILEELENNFAREAHLPQIGGRLEAEYSDGQMMLFDPAGNTELDPVLEKLLDTDIEKLTPLQAINVLEAMKEELKNR